MPYLLEGTADRYEHFLNAVTNYNLVAISDDFHFRIQTSEYPGLQLRHVRTHGSVSNQGTLNDAFFALMLSYPPGQFSSRSPLGEARHGSGQPTLHWHLANQSCINHHRNSTVTYLRLESASLLAVLCHQAIAVSQLSTLQGVIAPMSLVELIEGVAPQLTSAAEQEQQQLITQSFLQQLGQELRQLLGPPTPSHSNAAGYACRAIDWMGERLHAPIKLDHLAHAIALTPRTVQICFKRQLGLSPMRWLKLARLSQLRHLLWDRDLEHQSLQQLMGRCGLNDTSLNRQAYRDIYGVSPSEQRRQAADIRKLQKSGSSDASHRQFDNPEAAIHYLQTLGIGDRVADHNAITAMRITVTVARLKPNPQEQHDPQG
jgi:AraC-like DNA-binding protein